METNKICECEREIYNKENRIDYSEILPGTEEMLKRYIEGEEWSEGTQILEKYIFRKSGRLHFTWGWYLEFLQNKEVKDMNSIEQFIFKMVSGVLKTELSSNQEFYQKVVNTIVYFLFVYEMENNGRWIKTNTSIMLNNIFYHCPWLMKEICKHPRIIPLMQSCRNRNFEIFQYCLEYWKRAGEYEQEITIFLRESMFLRYFIEDGLSKAGNNLEKEMQNLYYLEEYTDGHEAWMKLFAKHLLRIGWGGIGGRDIPIKPMLERLYEKGVDLLVVYLQDWRSKEEFREWSVSLYKVEYLLALQKDTFITLEIEEMEKFIKDLEGMEVVNFPRIYKILERCSILMKDPSKTYFFHYYIGLSANEEQFVNYYRKGLIPKSLQKELISKLRLVEHLEKIPLLLQWLYEGEENEE